MITDRPQNTPTSATSEIGFDSVQSEVSYLMNDERFNDEKPYELAFDGNGVIPQTNMSDESHKITIQNFRPLQNSENFGRYGFAVMKLDDPLTAAQYRDPNVVKERYYASVERLLSQSFPGAAAIRIIEHDASTKSFRCRARRVDSI